MQRELSRNDVAFARYMRRYQGAATAIATRTLGDQDDAEDVVQEAFAALHAIGAQPDGASFRALLLARVRRLAKSRRVRDQCQAARRRSWSAAAKRDRFVSNDEESAAISRLDAERATRALRVLSPMQRACFELTAIGDRSAEEVGETHGISAVTVRQHTARARRALRRELRGTRG